MEQLTSAQLSEWEAYDRLDPIGQSRDDFRMAKLASVIANAVIQVHGKKGAKLTVPKDFMPEWDVEKLKRQQTVEEMKQAMLAIASAQNKKLKNKGTKR